VVELYLRGPRGDGAPLHSLRGFQRLRLQPSQTKHVIFPLRPVQLSEVDRDGKTVFQAGDYSVFLGGAQPGQGAEIQGEFSIMRVN
jgi:beta-glucosidase